MAATTGPGSDHPFTWTLPDGTTVTLPSMSKADPDMNVVQQYLDTLESSARGNSMLEVAANLRFLRKAFPDHLDELAKIGQLRLSQVGEFLSAWAGHSGTSPGELSAS